MITIDWPGSDAEGWTDFIPIEWFAKIGRIESVSHSISKPVKRPLLAKLSIDVQESEALLDYCGDHTNFDEKHGIEVGLIKITFAYTERLSIVDMLWKDTETDSK